MTATVDEEVPAPASPPPSALRRSGLWWWLVPLLVTAGVVVGLVAVVAGRSEPPVPPARYVIPPGTGQAMDAGEHFAVLPSVITMKKGVELVIENRDERAFDLGTMVIGPHQTFRTLMSDVGTFRNQCRLSPTGDVTFVVF